MRLVDRHSDAASYRLACILVGNEADAEDVLQGDLSGHRSDRSRILRGRSAVKTWLTRILINRAHNLQPPIRRVRRATSVDDALVNRSIADAEIGSRSRRRSGWISRRCSRA